MEEPHLIQLELLIFKFSNIILLLFYENITHPPILHYKLENSEFRIVTF